MYTLDTNAIIYYLKNDPSAVSVLEPLFLQNVALYVSTITELELYSYPALTANDISSISRVLNSTVIIPVDSRLAQLAGYLRRTYRLKTADSAIAATVLLTHTTLVTRDTADFQRVPALSLLRA